MYYHKTKLGAAAEQHLREFIIKAFSGKETKQAEQIYRQHKKNQIAEVNKMVQNKEKYKRDKKELLSIKLPNLNKYLKDENLGIMITNDLTEIEQQIYDLLIDGNSYEEVANVLQRKITTIKTHVAHIFDKKQVNSLQRLIVKHYKEKLSQYENTSTATNNLDLNISLLNKLF